MAFGTYPYYPPIYPQYPQASMPQVPQVPQAPQTQQQAQPQIQNGGFVSIHGEQEARNYPVGVGMSVTFKDETAPYIYTKTMGFSQLDLPQFDKYRLVKEDSAISVSEAHTDEKENKGIDYTLFAKNDDLEALRKEFDVMRADLDELKATKKTKKKEADSDD